MATIDPATALVSFGFTGLESQIYAFLVTEAPATGYRIAQAIGKPVANTYKAIQTLQAKGAIEVEDGDSRLCRAVPSTELLDRLGREFEQKRADAKETFGKIAQGESDDRVYTIRSKNQAMQRARQMFSEARNVALLSAPSSIVQSLKDELTEAGQRGVEIAVKSDAEISIPRVEGFVIVRDDDLLRHGHFLRLVIDGRQWLAGLVRPMHDDAEMVWSRSRALSLLVHEGLAAEISLVAVAERIEDGAGPKRLAKALSSVRPASATLEAPSESTKAK
jgi:HTH-type transcriptional regulator, sugar sensing transcriptional regulator